MSADSFIDEDHPLMRDPQGRTIIIAEDEPTCLEDLSPKEKVEYFLKGMKDNSTDLVAFRNSAELRDHVAEFEKMIWSIKSDLEFVVTSIMAERGAQDAMQSRRMQSLVRIV